MKRAIATLVGTALLVAGCGNFFPNPSNIVLPSGLIAFELDCGPVPRGECEDRARKLEAQKRTENPALRIKKLELTDDRGSYNLTYSDGNSESMIVD